MEIEKFIYEYSQVPHKLEKKIQKKLLALRKISHGIAIESGDRELKINELTERVKTR